MSWKLPEKLLCITLFFTSCHWYNIVVYFTKKNAFQSTKIFRRIQWQNMLRMHLLQSRISKFWGGTPVPPELSPTCACGTWFVPPPVNSPPTSILFENPGYINVNKGVFYLIICFLRIKIYNVLNYNNCSTDWSFSLRFQILLGLQMASLKQ